MELRNRFFISVFFLILISSCSYETESKMGMQEIYEVDDPCLYIEEIDRLLTDALYFQNTTFQMRKLVDMVFEYQQENNIYIIHPYSKVGSAIIEYTYQDYNRVTEALLPAGVPMLFYEGEDRYGIHRFSNSDFTNCEYFISAKEKYERLMNR